MNRIRSWIRAFLGFSRNETNAFLLLLPLMFIAIFFTPVYQYFYTRQEKDYSNEKTALDSLIVKWKKKETKDSTVSTALEFFSFDPNTATKEELERLGFPPYLATRLVNYRNKGGKFTIKSDLLKLFGMDTAHYKTLYAWIKLPEERPQRILAEKKETAPTNKLSKAKFDLNLADTTQFISIYGIGGKLSVRIIRYRDRLGGFVSMDQLKEVYGLDTAIIHELKKESFIAEGFQPKKININTTPEKELAAHPYIKYAIAKAIAAYRFQHGEFKSIDDLTQIAIIDKSTFEKIKPYLSVNP